MTTAFQASIKYPLIWIINLQSPDDFRVKRNENYRQFPRLASMRSYLLAHYLCSYQYEQKQTLLNGETELEIPHLLGVHVENIRFLNFHFYKKSFSEVYVDAFFRADMTAYTGSEDNPQRRSVYSDYLIRGYYDFKSSRVRLMQGIMPVSKAYPLPYTELDDYLLPKYSVSDIEEAAQEILCENYPYSIYGKINSNILAKSLELSIYKTGLGDNEPDGGRFYCRDTKATLYTSEQKSFQTTVPSKTILIERSLTAQQQKNAAFHEIAHAVQHSLFYFLQEKYHVDLKENYNNTPKWLPLSNEEQKILNRMERQADQLGFRLRIPEDGIEELMQKLMAKYIHIDDMREKLNNIIDEIANFYDITPIMARNRLIDIGYIQAKGIYDMIDGKIVPAYIPPEDMKPYQTYSITNVMNTIKSTISNIWNSVKSAVSSIITGIKDAIVNGFNNAVNFVKNLAGEAWSWGADIINGIVDGIKSKIQAVADAVTGVADKIKSFLHFSVPDEGPLTDFESWMPDFMQGLADGISANAGLVGDALSTFGTNVTTALTDTFKTAMSNIVTTVQTFMETTLTEVTNVWNNISTSMTTVLTNIGNAVKNGWNAITTSIKTSLENIKTAISTSWTAVKNIVTTAINGIKTVISTVWNAIKNFISTGQLDIKNTINTTWMAITDGVKNTVNSVKSTVSSAWNAMPDAVRGAMNNIRDTVFSIWDNVKNGIGDRLGGIRDAVSNGLNSVADCIRNIINSSWQWGYDIMQNLINGIRYMLSDLINTVADVANSIWEYLHFSIPEKGPLTDFESWMPDFMKGLANGINKSKKYVETAVSGVADAMQLTMKSRLSMKLDGISGAMMNGGGGTTVINNYNNDNSRTVNQTNNSPKSLSRLEIYRQTRNALKV